ncbi:protein-tyrosine phosphatase [Oceanisphaera litoralis]|uniref:phosphatase domain-containing protein n=1 Tax=Oceanisphaera litoralis TaxID=225144 RepID=UPI00195E675E|nr:tyrosine-protein phosphatase [Oceanisphaera litoralis]MBM7457156.1 protein-tyrosine phosphatase [Oceanisphaera litoralis]
MNSANTHPVWYIDTPKPGRLALTPCPGTQTCSLADSLTQLYLDGAGTVISLTTDAELAEKNVSQLPELVTALGMRWLHLPIYEDGVPDRVCEDKWQANLVAMQTQLAHGKDVVIHCMTGSGRAGLMAYRLLRALGVEPQQARDQIKAVRPNAFTLPEQNDYIKNI